MRWVTWQSPRVDRMGCAWLIRRFVDLDAEFVFISVGQTVVPEGCEPFDIPGARLSHHRGHASFRAIVAEYRLQDPVLEAIARIVDEADVSQELALEPAAPGLDLICRGLSLLGPDDATRLERGALVYDALYAILQAEGDAL